MLCKNAANSRERRSAIQLWQGEHRFLCSTPHGALSIQGDMDDQGSAFEFIVDHDNRSVCIVNQSGRQLCALQSHGGGTDGGGDPINFVAFVPKEVAASMGKAAWWQAHPDEYRKGALLLRNVQHNGFLALRLNEAS